MSSTGPAIRAVCRIVNQNSCGSGSICGLWKGGSLVLTNAHVAGTQVGRVVRVEVEALGMKRLNGTVIRAAYSENVSADWALIHVEGFQAVKPVYLTKHLPPKGMSLYTKGFPKCQAFNGTDIAQHAVLNNGVLLWLPDAIPGQSGSGVWGDNDHLQYALLTWSMRQSSKWYGAGQLTAEIYKQNRAFELGVQIRGYARMPGLIELPSEFNFDGTDNDGLSDPVVKQGMFSIPMETGIGSEFPIWAEDQQPPPSDPPPGGNDWRKAGIDFMCKQRETIDAELKAWESQAAAPIDPTKPGAIDDRFGL